MSSSSTPAPLRWEVANGAFHGIWTPVGTSSHESLIINRFLLRFKLIAAGRGVRRPFLGKVHLRLQGVSHVLVELIGEVEATRPVLMLVVSGAKMTGHEDDFLFPDGGRRRSPCLYCRRLLAPSRPITGRQVVSQCGFHYRGPSDIMRAHLASLRDPPNRPRR